MSAAPNTLPSHHFAGPTIVREVAVVALLLAAASAGYLAGHYRTQTRITPAAPAVVQGGPATPAGAVTVATFLDEYRSNELAARDRYNGHEFDVAGTVSAVREFTGSPVVQLTGTDSLGRPSELLTVNAFISEDARRSATRLEPGDGVLLRCGSSARFGMPYLSHCDIVARP